MKHKLSSKLISVLLAVIMVVSIIPVGMINANAASTRQIAVDYMNQMGTVRWTATGTWKGYKSECTFVNGTSYTGIPYSQSGTNMDLAAFSKYNGRVSGQPGRNDCSSAVWFAWRAAGYKGYSTPFSTYEMRIGRTTGKYDIQNKGTNYSSLLPGDALVNDHHAMLVVGNNPSAKTLTVTHNTGSFSTKYNHPYSSWAVNQSISYSWLGSNGYNGVTCSVLSGTATTPPVTINTQTVSSSQTSSYYYNASARYDTGIYKCSYKQGVNIRTGASTRYSKVGLVAYNTEIHITSTNGNWGYGSYAGKSGWVCLDFLNKVIIPIPAVPGTPNVSASDIAKGKTVTITWGTVSGATGYKVAIRGAESKDIDVGNTTSYTYQLNSAATYNFYVSAYNVSGSSAWSGYKSCTAHNPVTVDFVDWDDSPLTTVTVTWGESAKSPDSPYRKGYTFQGWNDSYFNVKTNKTIKATYKINTYIVNFFDREGVLIESQKVTYGSDATPPTDTHATARYEFKGWSSTDYIDVYTDRADKNINIDGIYAWDNEELPVECTIKSAERQFDGYTVVIDIENGSQNLVTGRAVVALKTTEGKLVDMTESTAFSIKTTETKRGIEVFLPCKNAASQVEVFMVANYSSGVPISSSDTAEITKGQMYAESRTMPENPDGSLVIESITKYRYRDKLTTTGNSNSLDGWTWDNTRNAVWQSQTGLQDSKLSTYDNDSGKRVLIEQKDVPTYGSRTKYEYYHWRNYNKGKDHVLCPVDHGGGNYHYFQTYSPLTFNAYSSCNGAPRYGNAACPNGCTNKQANNECWWQKSWSESYQNGTKTQYNYATYKYTYNFFRYTPWQLTESKVVNSDTREVIPEQWYRYETKEEIPEDNSGVERWHDGNLGAENAGKQVTLYVYGYTGASDYTNEYIGQTTVESDGHYSFAYKLREEPTEKTGDFTVAIGVEGSSDIKVVDTIKAPKPVYTVNFYDWDGSIISTQQITKGENATPPTNPTKEGFKFLGWDKSVTNITEDTDIFADFEREEYTVVFVDWENQTIKMEKLSYGDILVAPEAETVEGYDFIGWDAIENGKQYVTSDMIVTAKYEKRELTVKFLDDKGAIVDTQTVLYGESAIAADDIEKDGLIFAGWYNPEEYQNVKQNATIVPLYYFEETTPVPQVNHESGEYSDNIQLTLSSDDENAVIYYYLNDDVDNELIYTKPFTISKTCTVTYHAESLGKNNSEEVTQYYCINTSDKPSEWMLYNDLPEDVKNNPADFTVEQETGYSYKDVETTSSAERITELSEDGWTLAGVDFSEYTSWQDEPIADDSTKLGFEVDKAYVNGTSADFDTYRYSHYKYTEDGQTKYYFEPVDGFDCEYEEVFVDKSAPYTMVDFIILDNSQVPIYKENAESSIQWFKPSKMKTQYRSRYKVAEYYKWTDWSVDLPVTSETREQKSDNVFRYYNKNYHIVTVKNDCESESICFLVEHLKIFDSKDVTQEGNTLEGLYTDGELLTKFNISTPITESITLYANFTPKSFTIIFQMQDGTELDTQMVDYMSAATAPDTDSVPGWVFAGWDKDFSSITEDTVVTGRYVRESEYARISLPRSTYNMYTSTKISLEPTITPEHLSESKVEWTSSDTSVAIVDENGNVTAVGAGEAIITVTVLSSREKAECKVIVKADLATTILLKSNSKLNYDDLGFIRRIKYKTDVDTVAAEFENSELSFYKVDGTKLAGTDFVGTGAQIKLFDGDNVIDSKTVVVTGDLNGDAIINNRDVAVMNRYVAELLTLEDYQAMAFDANGDGAINNRDVALIARFLVGKEAL